LEQEKAEVHENLDKKLTKIVELHKELEEKSKEVAEKPRKTRPSSSNSTNQQGFLNISA
jgi:hypothetical protein